MSIPGNPMVFVNREFCRVTEYRRHEATGRNCRFLQGPKTEPASVAVIRDTLRRGVDCHVKITNYRKSGDTFLNLLTMRPVHDSNGVYRFCIAVQFEVKRDASEDVYAFKLDQLRDVITMLPRHLHVVSLPVGPARPPPKVTNASLAATLQDALDADPTASCLETWRNDLSGEGELHNYHSQHLSDLARATFAAHFSWVDPMMRATIDDSVSVAVSDAQLPGFPLILVNRAFEAMTGYVSGEVLGRNCRILQCPQTEPEVVQQIRVALRAQQPIDVRITNRRKNGTSFVNLLSLRPILDSVTGCTRLVIATQHLETPAPLAGAEARDDAAAIFTAIPRTMRFSTPALPTPTATPSSTPALPTPSAPSASEALSPAAAAKPPTNAASTAGKRERDSCWVGSPLRHHLAALRGLLQLRSEGTGAPSGSKAFLDFLSAHWRQLGRVQDSDVTESVLNVALSLHSKNAMLDALQLVQEMVEFDLEAQPVLASPATLSGMDLIDRVEALHKRVVAEHVVRLRKAAVPRDSDAADLLLDEDEDDDGDCMTLADTTANDKSTKMLRNVEDHVRALHCLLIFDAWRDFISSSTGTALRIKLADSRVPAEVRLAEQIGLSTGSLPSDTDEWIRLFISAVQDLEMIGVIVCDASLGGVPIIHANAGFQRLNGYTLDEMVGRSCRFMQGPRTDSDSIAILSEAIRTGTQAHVRLLNYRKDGTHFHNMLSLRPLFDRDGHMVFVIAFSIEVLEPFRRLKPLLTQVDRLNKLLPDKIDLPAPPSVKERVSLMHERLAFERGAARSRAPQRRLEESGGGATDDVSKAAHVEQTIAEKAAEKAQARIEAYKVRQAAKRNEASAATSRGLGHPVWGSSPSGMRPSSAAPKTPAPPSAPRPVPSPRSMRRGVPSPPQQ